MRIAVYSGSFNPLHIGHLAIMKYLSQEAYFDMVYLVVSPQNPLKDSNNADSGRTRLEAAKESLSKYPDLKVKVDDIELNMPAPQYTVKTLDELKRREPDNGFTLIIGADNLAIIRKWRDYERILSEYGVAVYPREGYDAVELRNGFMTESSEFKIRLIDAPKVNISSTEIRQGLSEGKQMSEYQV